MKSIKGKYFSILGASTSTFDGISNNTEYNSTIANNVAYYPKDYLSNASDTWWLKVVDALELKLCVNNSWAGSCLTTLIDGEKMAGCMDRATQLHNDKLNIEPDVIILIIGGNDALRGYEIGNYNNVSDIYDETAKNHVGDCQQFGKAYATMVHKVKNRYPNADIYVCSMLHWNIARKHNELIEYNEVIEKIANEFGVSYVDFYNQTNICPETATTYLHTDGIHPNKYGFEQMANCIIRTLKTKYN